MSQCVNAVVWQVSRLGIGVWSQKGKAGELGVAGTHLSSPAQTVTLGFMGLYSPGRWRAVIARYRASGPPKGRGSCSHCGSSLFSQGVRPGAPRCVIPVPVLKPQWIPLQEGRDPEASAWPGNLCRRLPLSYPVLFSFPFSIKLTLVSPQSIPVGPNTVEFKQPRCSLAQAWRHFSVSLFHQGRRPRSRLFSSWGSSELLPLPRKQSRESKHLELFWGVVAGGGLCYKGRRAGAPGHTLQTWCLLRAVASSLLCAGAQTPSGFLGVLVRWALSGGCHEVPHR